MRRAALWPAAPITLPAGWVASKPATQITPAFNPQLQYLPDPTQYGTLRPGLFLIPGASPTPRTGLVHKWRLIIPAQVSSHPKPLRRRTEMFG